MSERGTILPNTVVLAEMSGAELCQPSGEVDLVTKRPLSRFETLQRKEAEEHGGSVVINADTRLSDEARGINSAVNLNGGLSPEQKHGRHIVAVVAFRPPKRAS